MYDESQACLKEKLAVMHAWLYPDLRGLQNSGGNYLPLILAGMMELVDMRDLGSRASRRWGSSPHARTISRRHLGEQGGMKKTPVYRGFSSMLCINFSSIDETFADRVAPKNKCRNWYLKYNLIKSGADAPLFYLFGANGTSLFTSLFVYSPSVGSLYTSKRPFRLPQI